MQPNSICTVRARFKISGSRIADYASLVHTKRNGKHGIDREECLSLRAGTDTNAFSLSVRDPRPCSTGIVDPRSNPT
jgi:hypothetical protein